MKFTPHPYQQKAERWIMDHPRCCLFLDMGLGKSVVTLTAVSRLIDSCDVERVLVVAPKKVAESTWSDEAAKWDHLRRLSVARCIGTERKRIAALEEEADVTVIGRDSFVWLMAHCQGRLPFDMIVIDELTSFKSPKSRRFRAMRLATAQVSRMVGLTGTPAPNGLVDLWAQMYCIDQGQRLGKFVTRYRDRFFDQRTWNHVVVSCTPKKGAEKEIRGLIADICLSMTAKDYLSLPPLIVSDEVVELPEKVAKDYKAFERDRVVEFMSEHKGASATVMAANAAALMGKLAQYASGAVYDTDGNWHEIHDEKTQRLAEIIEASDSGVLVFYQYRHEAERIMRDLIKYRPRMYEGPEDLKEWNAGNIRLLLAHPASTAYGLNMQQGGHVAVWYGPTWNLELYQQANARLHRQGQTRPVTVARLIAAGTVDRRAVDALASKDGAQRALVEGLKGLVKTYG